MKRLSLFFLVLSASIAGPTVFTGCREAFRIDGAKLINCESLPAPSGDAVCSYELGASTGVLLRGIVLGVDTIYRGGEVLVAEDGSILHAGCSADRPSEFDEVAEEAVKVTCAEGVISPGKINAHTHTGYDSNFPVQLAQRFDHRNDWRPDHHWSVNYLPQEIYSEVRHLLAGTTASVSGSYIAGPILNLDILRDPVTGNPSIQWNTFPLESGGDFVQNEGACELFPKYAWYPDYVYADEYVPHVAEGVNEAAHNELRCLSEFMDEGWTLLHGIATTPDDGKLMAERGVGLVWSPRSNVSLYGNTAQVRMLKNQGVLLSLGSDWTPTGSMDLQRELQCANLWNSTYLDRAFTDRDLWLMTTYNPAVSLGVDWVVGSLSPGTLAQITVYDGRGIANPYRAVIDGTPDRAALVLVGDFINGPEPHTAALYGDLAFLTTLAAVDSPIVQGCEPYAEPMYGRSDVCGRPKFVCTHRPEVQDAFNELVENPLNPSGPPIPWVEAFSYYMENVYGVPGTTAEELSQFENLSFYNWVLGSYPLVFCGKPDGEPSCVPSRPGEYDGSPIEGPPATGDLDGDGIVDIYDNCRKVFNPVRPMDNGVQPDADGDGIGDACDRCPLESGVTCVSVDPYADAAVHIDD
jgi:hypothetical protein